MIGAALRMLINFYSRKMNIDRIEVARAERQYLVNMLRKSHTSGSVQRENRM